MLDRKFDNENDRQCIQMLWQKCLPQHLTRYNFLYDNFLALIQMEITYQKANNVVKQNLPLTTPYIQKKGDIDH